jgi:hypothetical protein
MDEQGYVPVTFIASFKRVRELSQDISLVMKAMIDMEELELSSHMVWKYLTFGHKTNLIY